MLSTRSRKRFLLSLVGCFSLPAWAMLSPGKDKKQPLPGTDNTDNTVDHLKSKLSLALQHLEKAATIYPLGGSDAENQRKYMHIHHLSATVDQITEALSICYSLAGKNNAS